MIWRAAELGLKEVCFTDHIDREENGCDEMVFDFDDYNASYSGLEIPKGLQVRYGVEYGLKPTNVEEMQVDLSRRHFDFVIGSIHLVDEYDIYLEPYWQDKSQYEAERRYFQAMLDSVQAHDDFDVLGHLTFISRVRANPTHRLITMDMHGDLIDEVLKTLVAKGKGLEINTSGVDRCGDYLPGVEFLKRFRELGGQIVTVGSDAHTASRVGQYSREACAIAKEIFGHVCTFADRKVTFHKL